MQIGTGRPIFITKKRAQKVPLVAQRVKGLMLPLKSLGSLPWCRFDPWPWNLCMPRAQPNRKKKKEVPVFNRRQSWEVGSGEGREYLD